MVTPHQRTFAKLGPDARGVLLDSPYGFQENADELTEKAQQFFRESVGREVEAVTFRSAPPADPEAHALEMARLRAGRLDLRRPRQPVVRPAHVGRQRGARGAARAAARGRRGHLRLGRGAHARPGHDPGLRGLQGRRGPALARRARRRSARPPGCAPPSCRTTTTPRAARTTPASAGRASDGCACSSRCCPRAPSSSASTSTPGSSSTSTPASAEVVGRGTVVVRVHGDEWVVPTGETITLEQIAEHGRSELAPVVAAASTASTTYDARARGRRGARARRRRRRARPGRRARPRAPTTPPRARPCARCSPAPRPPWASRSTSRRRSVRYVELLLTLRGSARADKRFADSDAIRDGLAAAGIEVRDTADGVTWEVRP